jgi:DNA-binding MurR/RpiR family transcriptional regulator
MVKERFKKPKASMPSIHIALVEKLKQNIDNFTPRQRALAEFILQNPESLAFLTITDLAKKVGVSEATITRFCSTLGYDGFIHLCREVQEAIQSELSTVGRFQLTQKRDRRYVETQAASTFERIFSTEIDNLISLSRNIRTDDFYRCVDLMSEADRICIVGSMASSCLASYFGYMLKKIFPEVDVLHNQGGMAAAVLNHLTPKSLVFLISFPRYPKVTVELGQLTAQKAAHIIAITNSPVSPIVPLADIAFFIPLGIVSFIDAYAAPIAFLNALITEFSERNPEATQQSLKFFDEYVSRAGLFIKSSSKNPVKQSKEPKKFK